MQRRLFFNRLLFEHVMQLARMIYVLYDSGSRAKNWWINLLCLKPKTNKNEIGPLSY